MRIRRNLASLSCKYNNNVLHSIPIIFQIACISKNKNPLNCWWQHQNYIFNFTWKTNLSSKLCYRILFQVIGLAVPFCFSPGASWPPQPSWWGGTDPLAGQGPDPWTWGSSEFCCQWQNVLGQHRGSPSESHLERFIDMIKLKQAWDFANKLSFA